MTESDITATLKTVLADIAPEADLDRVGPEENLREELELDSMDALHVLVGLSQELDVEIPAKDYGRLTTKADIVHYLQARVPEKQRGT